MRRLKLPPSLVSLASGDGALRSASVSCSSGPPWAVRVPGSRHISIRKSASDTSQAAGGLQNVGHRSGLSTRAFARASIPRIRRSEALTQLREDQNPDERYQKTKYLCFNPKAASKTSNRSVCFGKLRLLHASLFYFKYFGLFVSLRLAIMTHACSGGVIARLRKQWCFGT